MKRKLYLFATLQFTPASMMVSDAKKKIYVYIIIELKEGKTLENL